MMHPGFNIGTSFPLIPADLQKLASAFGLQYYEQNNQISHSMSTILLAPDGTCQTDMARQ